MCFQMFSSFFSDFPKGSDQIKLVDMAEIVLFSILDWCFKNTNILEAVEKSGAKFIHFATEMGYTSVIEKVLKVNGYNQVHSKDDQNQFTPLFLASTRGHTEIVKMLLQSGAEVNCQEVWGFTPLHGASKSGHFEVAKLLIENGANVSSLTKEKWTPLHLATNNGHVEVAELLLQNGANANHQDRNLQSPLHSASMNGNSELVKLLIQNGGNIECSMMERLTPLHLSIFK